MKIQLTFLFFYLSLIFSSIIAQNNLTIKEKYDYLTSEISIGVYSQFSESDEANYGDGYSKILNGYLELFELTEDKGYLYRFVNESLKILYTRHDNAYPNSLTDNKPRWTFVDDSDTPPPNYYSSNYLDGYIIQPMAKFSFIINKYNLNTTPLYQFEQVQVGSSCVDCFNYTNTTFNTFGDYSSWLQDRVGETLNYFINNGYWDNYNGFLQTNDQGNSYSTLKVNQQAGFSIALLYNAITSGNQDYLNKSAQIASRMKGDILLRFGIPFYQVAYNGPWLFDASHNSYSWYQLGWRPLDLDFLNGNVYEYFNGIIEDMSHGAVDVAFFNEYYNNLPIPFITEQDMVKFHNTFTNRLYDGNDEFYLSVNGTDYGYNPTTQSGPFLMPHNLFKFAALNYADLGDFELSSGALSNVTDNKTL